jgi:hypothetical protein
VSVRGQPMPLGGRLACERKVNRRFRIMVVVSCFLFSSCSVATRPDQSTMTSVSDGWTPSEAIIHDGSSAAIIAFESATRPEFSATIYRTGIAPLSGFKYVYYADGSGDVEGEHIKWDIRCLKDKISDKRKCSVNGRELVVLYGQNAVPQAVCASSHDFPGRHAVIRIDSLTPTTTPTDGCIRSKDFIAELQRGKTVVVRFVKWPYDENRDSEETLAGLDDAMQLAQFLQTNLDQIKF